MIHPANERISIIETMMKLERISADNLELAVSVQETLFPNESARVNFEESISGAADYEYYLIYEDDTCAGVIGIYSLQDDPCSAWLGWFGILSQFRRNHLGSEALKKFEEMAAAKHFKYARFYTDEEDNDTAIAFYKAAGYTPEPYRNEDDEVCMKYKTLIFSKTLCDEPVPLWNNRNMHLTAQIAKQEEGNRRHT